MEGNAVRVSLSPIVGYGILGSLMVGYGTAAWFLATQAATLATTAERQIRSEVAVQARLDQAEKRDDARAGTVGGIDSRLARIEAQIAYMLQNGASLAARR